MRSSWQLFQPGQIGHLQASNRIVMAPMATNLGSASGEASDRLIAYYRRRAMGGAGTIIVEAACVDAPLGRASCSQLNIDHPRCIKGLKQLSSAIQSCGSLAFIQISHAGRQAYRTVTEGLQPVAPSAIPCPMVGEMPRAMELEDIERIAGRFVAAADYAAAAGFDGVEIHACHGYLINQFLSPHSNARTDEYGGSLENRQRFLLDILRAIKQRQPALLVSVRLNIDDFVAGGLQADESLEVCRALEKCGASIIHASSGTYASGLTSIEPGSYPEGWRLYLAEAVKKSVGVPVIGGGMLSSPAMAEKALADGQADFIFIGRSLLADPFWAWHAARGEDEHIRPCIRCNNCIESMFNGLCINCTVNPEAGREVEACARPVSGPDSSPAMAGQAPFAWIAGAGPAGLYAALSLLSLGVKVRIFDPAPEAGGLMGIAARPPFKQRIEEWRQYLVRVLNRYDVQWSLGLAFEPSLLVDEIPDLLVIATGARPLVPELKGLAEAIEQGMCLDSLEAFQRPEMLDGHRVAILGGSLTGCELADLVSGRAASISIIEKERVLASGMEKKNRRSLLQRLDASGVLRCTGMKALEIDSQGVRAETGDGRQSAVPASRVVLATGFASRASSLFQSVQGRVPRVYIIGDASRPRGFKEAALEGSVVGERFARAWNESG